MKRRTAFMMWYALQWVVFGLWILILPTNGYIINDEGHLVPFKVYKKGHYPGIRMLAPRNCDGGYRHHKRRDAGSSSSSSSDNLYELQVFKRQVTQQTDPDMLHVHGVKSDNPFSKAAGLDEKTLSAEFRDFQDVHMPQNSMAYGLVGDGEENVRGNEKMAAVYHDTEDEPDLYNNAAAEKSKVLDSYRHQGIADPPPPDRKAVLEEYPLYDTLQALLANYYEQGDAVNTIFDPTEDLNLYGIRKRR